jgi:hypothetical protein
MTATITFSIVLTASALLFFLAPHHRRRAELFKPTTMAGIYRDFFEAAVEHFRPDMQVMLLLGLAGMLAAFYPALLVAMVRWVRPGMAWFVVAGIVATIGVVANFLAMLISHVNFGGGRSSDSDVTPFFWLILAFQGAFALASIVIGASGTCAGVAARFLGN